MKSRNCGRINPEASLAIDKHLYKLFSIVCLALLIFLVVLSLMIPSVGAETAEEWNSMGEVLTKLGRYEEALTAYDKAIEIDPQNATVWSNKGDVLHLFGRHEEALIAYDKALEIDPQNAEVWDNKGETLTELGRTEEAKEAFKKAHGLDPSLDIPSTLTPVTSIPQPTEKTSGFEAILVIVELLTVAHLMRRRK